MNVQELINSIGSVCFPIVACIGLFSLYDRTIKDIVNALDNVNSTLSQVNSTLDQITRRLEGLKEHE